MTTIPFAEALEPHYGDIARYCRALCAQWTAADAEDVLQESLLRALEHYDALRDPERFRPWLFRIVTTTFYAAARRRFWRRFVPLSEVHEHEMPAVYRGRETRVESQQLLRALARLSARDRAALLLFDVAGFSLEELAHIQGDRSLSAVKSRLSRARRRARVLLETSHRGTPAAKEQHSGTGHEIARSVEEATLRELNEATGGSEP